ncbi:unnamed protein product [Owenia fusiformis]|uniref:Uncharacterized protein n=1 Tax=Owenia fusiformis TaxID=6347 RepID=A0A8J1UV61_OWEFU|nr:unnamed protein product [Owenia fusiformis]
MTLVFLIGAGCFIDKSSGFDCITMSIFGESGLRISGDDCAISSCTFSATDGTLDGCFVAGVDDALSNLDDSVSDLGDHTGEVLRDSTCSPFFSVSVSESVSQSDDNDSLSFLL